MKVINLAQWKEKRAQDHMVVRCGGSPLFKTFKEIQDAEGVRDCCGDIAGDRKRDDLESSK